MAFDVYQSMPTNAAPHTTVQSVQYVGHSHSYIPQIPWLTSAHYNSDSSLIKYFLSSVGLILAPEQTNLETTVGGLQNAVSTCTTTT